MINHQNNSYHTAVKTEKSNKLLVVVKKKRNKKKSSKKSNKILVYVLSFCKLFGLFHLFVRFFQKDIKFYEKFSKKIFLSQSFISLLCHKEGGGVEKNKKFL